MKTITIIGGGVSGLTLGIGLRRAGVPVELFEAANYPRHKVCGEFISGAGQAVICDLGLGSLLQHAGAVQARTGIIFAGRNRSPIRALPSPATCISRHALDASLADAFVSAGGRLRTNLRHQSGEDRPGLVFANGRRPQPREDNWVWFGLKAHAINVVLEADLEMHLHLHGYVGLCRLASGIVNVCGLFRRYVGRKVWRLAGDCESCPRGERRLGENCESYLKGRAGSLLHQRLANARFIEGSSCSVAGLSWRRAPENALCAIGDAFAMTPPITGNGMSIAFETAFLSLDPLIAYAHEAAEWDVARQAVAERLNLALAPRLKWSRCLHRLALLRGMQGALGALVLRSGTLWNLLYKRTRAQAAVLTRFSTKPAAY